MNTAIGQQDATSTIEMFVSKTLSVVTIQKFLIRSAIEYSDIVDYPHDMTWAQKIHDNADIICVRDANGEIKGAIFCYCNDESTKTTFITFICTLSSCPKGTAYQLCLQYEQLAINRGMKQQMLEVKKTNLHAFQFYRRQGYRIVEDRQDRGRWLMQRDLP